MQGTEQVATAVPSGLSGSTFDCSGGPLEGVCDLEESTVMDMGSGSYVAVLAFNRDDVDADLVATIISNDWSARVSGTGQVNDDSDTATLSAVGKDYFSPKLQISVERPMSLVHKYNTILPPRSP